MLLAKTIPGFKAGDANFYVMPCALQADRKESPDMAWYDAKYIGARLTEADLPYLDAVNGHYYSYYGDVYSNGALSCIPAH